MKKTYHIPTVEVIVLRGVYPLMDIAGSKEYHPAPRNPHAMPAGGTKVF